MNLSFIDLFAGIGMFRMGLERAGHTCISWVEWDKDARATYKAIHDTKGEWTENDIRNENTSSRYLVCRVPMPRHFKEWKTKRTGRRKVNCISKLVME